MTPSGSSDSTTRGPKSSSVVDAGVGRRRDRASTPPSGAATGSPGTSPTCCTIRCVGKISSPGARDETRIANVCVASGCSCAVGERGLVAVVAVGDQERRAELELAGLRPARAASARRPRRRRRQARRPAARAAGRRRRAGRSARAASASRAADAAAPPSGRRACARAAAPRRPRRERRARTRRSPSRVRATPSGPV